jgi:hypothetical protein
VRLRRKLADQLSLGLDELAVPLHLTTRTLHRRIAIPSENNFVLNPLHPDFRKTRISRPSPFALDPRL